MWKALHLFTFLCYLSLGNTNKVPVFNNVYSVKGTLHIPYTELQEPFTAWYDGPNDRSRIDYYDGTAKTFQLGKKSHYGVGLRVSPETTEEDTNVETCFQTNGTSEDTRISAQTVLPNLTGYKLVGKSHVNGHPCEIWRYTVVSNFKVNNYTAYVSTTKIHTRKLSVPVRFEMKGFNLLLGSHYDHYYIDYYSYSTSRPHPSVFKVPNHLTCGDYPGPGAERYVCTFNPIREFIHNDIKHIDHAWGKFHKEHKKLSQYKSNNEHNLRKHVFHQNFRYIESINRANLGYKLAINHLADRTNDEIRTLRGRRSSSVTNNGGLSFPYSQDYLQNNAKHLPQSIDWRINGAVTPVKDQAVCGSCWAFGSTGTIEGAYFLKYGYRISLSEQALVDCSWGFGNNGCDGGEDFRSYHWIIKHGGIPTEAAYGPYLGEDGYCHYKGLNLTAKIASFVNVKSNDVTALKTALVNHGPISIGIDAAHRSFSFYSSGVYSEPQCGSKADDLDHSVLLVGYGKLNGKSYWLVKNSWSNHWGNDGYILFSQKNNTCGVMTAPTYVNLH